jgi:hypothetical protein
MYEKSTADVLRQNRLIDTRNAQNLAQSQFCRIYVKTTFCEECKNNFFKYQSKKNGPSEKMP